jgi:hypothetical protein
MYLLKNDTKKFREENYNMSGIMSSIEMWKWRAGGLRDFWLTNAEQVGKFIDSNKLKPISQESMEMRTAGTEKATEGSMLLQWWWKAGGIRVAHLHFEGNIYLLNANQWKAFSSTIIKEFGRKLSEAGTVNYGNLMNIADAMSEVV